MKPIEINKEFVRDPVIIQNYVWFWGCSICAENAVGRIKCSNFYFAITSPTYLENNGNIKKIGLCEVCIKEHKMDDLINKKILIDSNKKTYEIQGLEHGQYLEQLNYN